MFSYKPSIESVIPTVAPEVLESGYHSQSTRLERKISMNRQSHLLRRYKSLRVRSDISATDIDDTAGRCESWVGSEASRNEEKLEVVASAPASSSSFIHRTLYLNKGDENRSAPPERDIFRDILPRSKEYFRRAFARPKPAVQSHKSTNCHEDTLLCDSQHLTTDELLDAFSWDFSETEVLISDAKSTGEIQPSPDTTTLFFTVDPSSDFNAGDITMVFITSEDDSWA